MMHDWKSFERDGKMRKSIKGKLPLLGKKVRRKGEEGTVVIDTLDTLRKTKYKKGDLELEYFIMFKEDDMEQLIGLPFQVWNETQNRWEDENFEYKDMIVDLTDEEKEFLDIYSNLPFKSL